MAAKERETVRDAFVTLLNTALVGSGKPCKAVYGYLANRLDTSPAVCVSSAGAKRERIAKASWAWEFLFTVEILVPWADKSNWAADDAEDKMDEIETDIADVLESNQSATHWDGIDYDGRSATDITNIGGVNYRRETIPVLISSAHMGG